MNRKPAIGIGIAVAVAALGLAAWASDSARTEKPAAVDAQEYADFMAHEALDVQDLAEGAEIQRRTFNRMTPPGLSWVQPMFPLTVPFDAESFDEEFLDELLGEDRNSVAVYPLTLALDPKTRETWIYNAEGKPIAALPSEKTSRAWPEGSDPARVVLRLDLLPAEDVEPYLYVEDRIADSLAAVAEKAAKPARKEAVAKSSLSGGQFGFADAQKLTNGNFRLAVTNGTDAAEIFSYTIWHTSSVVVSTWTNDLDEVVVSTNVVWTPVSPPYAGLERAWDVETTNLILTNGVGDWEDASTAGSARVRFYGAARRADADEDGLTDGAEIFLHRTDPALTDTDGDGMPDGWEVSCGLNARSGLAPSLVGWWKLDDGAGSNAVNSAQDAYHGELVGFSDTNGGWTEDGYLGGALRFDGLDDWVRIAQVPALLTGGPFTVSAQVWLDLDCTSAWPEAVADYESSTWNGYCLGFNETRAYAMMGPYGWLMDSNALAGRWVWAALEYDGAQMRLYLDGVLAGATSAAFAPATNGFFAIGNGQDDSFGSEFWKGRIDDVRLYRAALGTNGLAGMYDAQEDPDGDGWLNLQESAHGTDPFSADTDEDGISDGDDPEPLVANQEPIVRFLHPPDGQAFLGPARIELSSEWIYGTQSPSQAVVRIESMLDGATNEIRVPAGNIPPTYWYAPPGIFRLTVQGVDVAGRTGETRQVDVSVAESESFAALTAAEKQAVLENGPRAVEGVEEWTYGYSVARPGSLSVAAAGSRILAGFAQATNFTAVPVSNSHLNVDYHDRDAMYATVVPGNTPTTNLFATLYGTARWGARLEANLPPPSSPRGWPVASDSYLVFDQNERGDWVGKVYPSLNNLTTNDPHALLNLGYGAERDAFFFRNGSHQVLLGPTNFNGEFDYRLVFGLNNEGLVIGAGLDYEAHGGGMYLGLEEYRPIVYGIGQTGTVLAVSTQAIGGAAYAVNDKGVIVGCEIASNEVPRAVRWVDGQVAAVGGLTGATQSVAFDVGEDGTIAGMQKIGGQWRPFLADAAGGDAFSPAMLGGVDFREFWHVGKFGALGWGASNNVQRLFWVFPDDDHDGFSDIVEREIADASPFDTLITIANVLGSDDFDGDGLTNAQEWEKQTDPVLKDSDGDRLPDGIDPWPLTRRDRDGDGLPDDWEEHYGLDPLSAAGVNGASGDLDGDGITNLEEFRLGGAPNSPADLGYVFHREKIGLLRVAIPDPIYCGGTNDHPPESVARWIDYVDVTDPALPPLDFTFKVSVTGRMERNGWDDSCVRINEQTVIAGSDEDFIFGCDMTNKTGYVLVGLNTSYMDWIGIEYVLQGNHHSNACAAVTDIELVDVRTNSNVLKVDLDIRETAQPHNRMGRDDPRAGLPAHGRNRILVWANNGANTITFDLVKPPDITSPVWIQIEDQTGLNSGMPHFERLDSASAAFTYTVAVDNDNADLFVRYGADLNSDGTLAGTDEIKGTYEVYGVTANEYADSRWNYNNLYLWGLHDMADQLHRRFAHGAFVVPTWPQGDYRPTSTSGSATLSADRFTHDVGANFADAGFVGIAGRQYYAATVTLPIYHYADNSTGSDLIRESTQLKDGLNNFVSQLSYATIATAYAAASGGATRSVTLSLNGAEFQFGATGEIGLGGVGVNSAAPYSSSGTITLEVTLNGVNYEVGTDAVADLTLHDVFDFDCFTPNQTADESRSAAMIQSGFGKTGSVANAGQVGLVEVEVDGDVEINGRTIAP